MNQTFLSWSANRTSQEGLPDGWAKYLVSALASHLSDESRAVVIVAATALEKIGPAATEAIPQLEDLAADTDFTNLAIGSLCAIGRPATDALVNLLQNRDSYVRAHAASGLSRLGSVPDEAIPLLIEALTDDYYHLRFAAAQALGSIGPRAKAAIPALSRLLNDSFAEVRASAGAALKTIRDA